MRLAAASLFFILICPAQPRGECGYPCWTEIPAAKFTFVSFAPSAQPPAAPGYEFSLPDPAQTQGGMSEQCNARENPDVDLYRQEGNSWVGPLSGPVYRNPLYSYVSEKAAGRKGIAVQVAFSGGPVSNTGQWLAQAVFFHDEPCYRASTEFGFDRYLKGLPGDSTVYFYYELHANCKPDGKCRNHQTGAIWLDQRESIPLGTPPGANSRGGPDWLYEAYLEDGGTLWVLQVRDPYTHKEALAPLRRAVKDFWTDSGKSYFAKGADGYITATAVRDGPIAYSGGPPTMNLAHIWVAK